MSTDPFQELPPPHQAPVPAQGLPAFFPAAPCPPPSRFWKVALELDSWSPTEQTHLAVCPHCRSVQERVATAARASRGPVIGSALNLPVPQAPPPPRSAPEPGVLAPGWFGRSWLLRGLRLLAAFCARLAPRPGACQRQTRRQRLGLDRLEDRDVLNGLTPWNAGWQPAMMTAVPVVVAIDGTVSEVAVPGKRGQDEQAWLSAFASLVWSGPVPEAAGA